jgi:hypothetical protein
LIDCDILVFVDSTGNPNGREGFLSPVISLDKPEGAALIASEETTVDEDEDSGLFIGMAHECWSVSGFANGLILLVLLMKGLD